MNPKKLLSSDLSLSIYNPVVQVGLIIFLVFLLVINMAQVRRHFIQWSFKGALFGIFLGFMLALILEGFLIIGGRTAITEVLGWKSAPKPLQTAVDAGRSKLVGVLGVTEEIPNSIAKEENSIDSAIEIIQSLDPSESKKLKSLICIP